MKRPAVWGVVTLVAALAIILLWGAVSASSRGKAPAVTVVEATATAAPPTPSPMPTDTPNKSPTAAPAKATTTATSAPSPTASATAVVQPPKVNPTPASGPKGSGSATASGSVLDASGKPLAGALASADGVWARTDSDGRFRLDGLSSNAQVTVRAPGYETVRVPASDLGAQGKTLKLKPFEAKGLYVSFYMVAWTERRDHLFDLVRQTELNTVVMDVKSDQGLVNESVSVPLAKQVGASTKLVDDLPGMIAALKKEGVYTEARIVVFKDKKLAEGRPDLAVKDTGKSGSYVDCEQQQWVDPFRKEVWDYNLAIAEAAAKLGFDEVQFDYIRFPSDCIAGSLAYSQVANPETRVQAIEGFLAAAAARLHPLGVAVGADIFGEMTNIEVEDNIGQDLEAVAKQVDYVYPMVYPSTWVPGSFGYDYPAANPYDIVYQSTAKAVQRTAGLQGKIRPWLQDFNDYGPRKLAYGATQVAQQIQASVKSGANGWMLWGPSGQYSEGALSR